MNWFLDLSLIAVVAGTVFFYWHRGLIKSLMGVAKTVLSILLTYMLGGVVAGWIETQFVLPALTEFVGEKLLALFSAQAEKFDLSTVFSGMPAWLCSMLQNFHVDVEALQQEYALVTEGSAADLQQLASSIASPAASILSSVIGYVAVFGIASNLLSVAAFFLSKVAEFPVIRQFDRTMGLLLGIVCALLFSSVYVVLIYIFFGWLEVKNPGVAFGAGFDSSWIFQHVYRFNLFKLLFGI